MWALTVKKPQSRHSKRSGSPIEAYSGQNIAVRSILRRGPKLQAKLIVGPPDDAYEKEADRVADQIMRVPDGAEPRIQRMCKECEEERNASVTRQPDGLSAQPQPMPGAVADIIRAGRNSGAALPPSERSFFESRLRHDFSRVRVHSGSDAADSAKALRAQAFTYGRDIYFSKGRYRPGTPEGRRLLAHELTHVVQQGGAEPKSALHVAVNASSKPVVARQSEGSASESESGGGSCVPATSGFPPSLSNCSAYIRNSWWLPLAYVNNATCACMTTPNSPTANCVRGFLQRRLAATPGWLKAIAATQKVNESNPALYPVYQAFVQAVLTPRFYSDHVDAYRSCCCPSGPAPYWAWMGVASVPIQPCSLVGASIRYFGSCHGTPGSW